jgi:SSS family solute:Na+ symporter
MEALCVAGYAAFLLVAACLFRHQDKAEDYLLAGRRVTLPIFVASLVSTWYGGILGVGEYTFKHGLSNWLVFGVPYYLAALIFALFLAKRARRTGNFTVPDQLLRIYGKGPALFGASVVFIMTAPAAYVLQTGVLLSASMGWPLEVGVIAGAAFSVVYLLRGGFRGDLLTDVVQFVLMFLGFGLLVGWCVAHAGGFRFLKAALPADHFTWHGGKPPIYIAAWYFIALAALVEPAFYQRCYAAKDERTARNGIFISILFWMTFDFLTTAAGLYARAVVPTLEEPVAAFPTLGQAVLPAMARGLFFVSMLAVIMSTVDSYLFIGGITLGRDIVWRLKRSSSDRAVNRYTRIAMVGTAVLAVLIALYFRSVVDIWHDLGSVGTPVLLLPLGTSFFDRLRPSSKTALAMMVGGGAVALLWLLWPSLPFGGEGYPYGIEPIFPGLLVSILLYLVGRATDRKGLDNTKREYQIS